MNVEEQRARQPVGEPRDAGRGRRRRMMARRAPGIPAAISSARSVPASSSAPASTMRRRRSRRRGGRGAAPSRPDRPREATRRGRPDGCAAARRGGGHGPRPRQRPFGGEERQVLPPVHEGLDPLAVEKPRQLFVGVAPRGAVAGTHDSRRRGSRGSTWQPRPTKRPPSGARPARRASSRPRLQGRPQAGGGWRPGPRPGVRRRDGPVRPVSRNRRGRGDRP